VTLPGFLGLTVVTTAMVPLRETTGRCARRCLGAWGRAAAPAAMCVGPISSHPTTPIWTGSLAHLAR